MENSNRTLGKYETLFIDYLVDDLKKYDRDCRDMMQDARQSRIKNDILIRKPTKSSLDTIPISASLIIEQAAYRYFKILELTQPSLDQKFTIGDIGTILNAECTPIWDYCPYSSIACMVADDNGIESIDELEDDSSMKILLQKLIELTPIQNVTLADICERIWRSKSEKSVSDLCEEMGMSLAD